ncbi:MAG: SDR family oxidoreductase [Kiritimatiellae bacterium]|nr:SDR family oxidoreductase [Kiritimatiellia bacterium]
MSKPTEFKGETALITGAAAGIGKACVRAFLARGATVVGADINSAVRRLSRDKRFKGVVCDVGDEAAISEAVRQTTRAFGGLDMLVLNAGIFMGSRRLDAMPLDDWRRIMRINVEGNLVFLREAYRALKKARPYGRVVILGSQRATVIAEGSAAYCTSKAAAIQLARMAALEWAKDGIRVNVVNPGRVCDTATFTAAVLRERAAKYGMTVAQYKRDNLLGVETSSRAVAEFIAALCGPAFAQTTGAQFPIDGGHERVI